MRRLALLLGEHPRRSIDPKCFARRQTRVQLTRELPGPAPQVHDAHPRRRPDHGEQVVERLLTLTLELVVLGRIPGICQDG